MDQLAKPELFYLLEKSRLTATNHEMQQAYETFLKEVKRSRNLKSIRNKLPNNLSDIEHYSHRV